MLEVITEESELQLLLSYLSEAKIFAFDTETHGLHGELVGMSFATDPHRGWYIPVGHRTLLDKQLEFSYVINELKRSNIFKNTVIGWNIAYEKLTMRKYEIEIPRYEDAQIIGWLVNENRPRALKERSTIEFKLKPNPNYSQMFGKRLSGDISIQEMFPYAIKDACLTWRIYWHLLEKLDKLNLVDLYRQVELPFVEVITDMIYRGIKVDRKVIEAQKIVFSKNIREAQERIWAKAGRMFNINSRKQLGQVLFEEMDLSYPPLTATGQYKLNKEVINHYKELGYPIAKDLAIYNSQKTLLEKFTDKLLEKLDGKNRVHPSFNQTGTETGRLSCSKPNFQQITKEGNIRRAFIPDKGYIFLIADYSQIEYRMMAHLSGDKVMVDAFLDDLDLHSVTASSMNGYSYEEFEKLRKEEDRDKSLPEEKRIFKKLRNQAKVVNFGVMYGMHTRLDLGVDEEFLKRYYSIHSGVKSYVKDFKQKTLVDGFTKTILGRRRNLPNLYSKDRDQVPAALREALSAKVQGSATGDFIKVSMINLYRAIKEKGYDAHIIAQIHDEIIIECKEEQAEEVRILMKEKMENALPLRVPVKAEPVICKNWQEGK